MLGIDWLVVVVVIAVFQMKVNRKSKYNLSDGEEEELVAKDDFEDDLSLEDEEEDGHVAKGMVESCMDV